ncbi:beta-N-acetylhexosaminidase [Seonamhaeicola maritimus]|uniref:beta-N-acetylhexosaminidase n=1 Tax=Seonamhaeicola maritimus TaxID=2591822 RepID=A0A5C7GHH2_9FLAO|nr:family 20 glycosylhydrolase [Seonamhaeicola maritimus]TXG36849.1 family 20 glycosylhydrolase [Seonamhaeicola maritimus]
MKNQLSFHAIVKFVVLSLLLIGSEVIAQSFNIIPEPVEIEQGSGFYTLNKSTEIIVPSEQDEVINIAAYLADKIRPATGFDLSIAHSDKGGIQLKLNTKFNAKIGKEGYNLEVTQKNIRIRANTPKGLFYGVQTLLQLLPPEIESKSTKSVNWQLPVVNIVDYPRFEWRGIMLDVSRHFFSKDYIKKYIDQIARYKYNIFHWHLTDDQGWRIEIKSYPKLTEIGSWRVPRTGTFGQHSEPKPNESPTYGGFYTQDDIREIIAYAKERYIEILPEIDVPGHSMAAIAAYPELSVTKDPNAVVNPGTNFSKWFGPSDFEMFIDNSLNPTDEKVYEFLDSVFSEVADLFPFEYIHMGGDECYKGFWKKDIDVQAFMKKKNIHSVEELQGYFNNRVAKIVYKNKKKLIGWDEILEEDLSQDAAIMNWRSWHNAGIKAAEQMHFVVMSPSPFYYLDLRQGDRSVEAPVYRDSRIKKVYDYNILPEGIDSTYVLGGQGNLWTEQIPTEPQVEYMSYPRAFAISESLWSPNQKKNWDNFIGKIENHFKRLDHSQINYATSMYDPIIEVTKNKNGLLKVELSTEVKDLTIYYTLDNAIPNQYHPKYSETIVLSEDVDMLRLVTYRNNKPIGKLITISSEELAKRVK